MSSLAETGPPFDVQKAFSKFLKTFRLEERGPFLYRDKMRRNINSEIFQVTLDLNHLFPWDPQFEASLLKTPVTTLLEMELAAKEVGEQIAEREIKAFELSLKRENWQPETLRSLALQSKKVGEMVKVGGLIVGLKKPGMRYKTLALKCKHCQHEVCLNISGLITDPLLICLSTY